MKIEDKNEPPEGGWGYVIVLAVFTIHLTTVIPITAFGLIHGTFLAYLGNETTGTTNSMTMFLATICFTGLLTGYLLGKYSKRKVGMIGAVCHLSGAILLVFSQNLLQFMFCFGILQGIGSGILLSTAISSLNEYFLKKMNLMTGISQISLAMVSIIFPPAMGFCLENIGYENTKIGLVGLSTLNLFAVWSLRPLGRGISYEEDMLKLKSPKHTNIQEQLLNKSDVQTQFDKENYLSQKSFSFALLKSPKFLNIAIGTALSFYADSIFVSAIGMVLHRLKFSNKEIATISMVQFGTDMAARAIFCVVSAFYTLKNRYVFYAAVFLSTIFRIALILRDDYLWRLSILAVLGFLRCFIQVPYYLIFSEEYRENFSTALSLFTVIGGFVTLALGAMMNTLEHFTKNDDLVTQVLSGSMIVTILMWSIEFGFKLFTKRNNHNMLQVNSSELK